MSRYIWSCALLLLSLTAGTAAAQSLFDPVTETGSGIVEQQKRNAVANVGGAGDAFLAALACAWLRGWPLQQSLEFANAVARVALDSASTINPKMSFEVVLRKQEKRDAAG